MNNCKIGVHSTPCWCAVHSKMLSHHVKVCTAHQILASVIHTLWCARFLECMHESIWLIAKIYILVGMVWHHNVLHIVCHYKVFLTHGMVA